MTNVNEYFTLDDINDVIEVFEDFLEHYGVRIPESDKQMAENGDDPATNAARIYGMVYGDLQMDLLELFEAKADQGKVKPVVNSWETEIEEWDNP